jgi:hypothetical protein
MGHVSLPWTTHTLELAQLAELNARLDGHGVRITASELGLEGARNLDAEMDGGLPASAVLVRLCWDGPPDYPYVHGHFALADQSQSGFVDLHTNALNELSRRLGVHQQWGA